LVKIYYQKEEEEIVKKIFIFIKKKLILFLHSNEPEFLVDRAHAYISYPIKIKWLDLIAL
jgi:hypothetical protein